MSLIPAGTRHTVSSMAPIPDNVPWLLGLANDADG